MKTIKMAVLTLEDRLLIKVLRTEKGWVVGRMTVDFLLFLESGFGANFVYITILL